MHHAHGLSHHLAQKRLECATTLLNLYRTAQVGHISSSLSCLELLVDLFFHRMKPADAFILSKGHAAAALYTVLAQSGRISEETLSTYYQEGTLLGAHPPSNGLIDEIPFGTGSLGHGLSLATGMAFADRFTKKKRQVYCILSDGECNEGSTWEAALFAQQHGLNHLTVLVDANGLQGFGKTQDVVDLEPFAEKWKSFGFEVDEIQNGNSFVEIHRAYENLHSQDRPRCLIARTIKGHSVSYMENQLEWHYLTMSSEQFETALKDIQKTFEVQRHA